MAGARHARGESALRRRDAGHRPARSHYPIAGLARHLKRREKRCAQDRRQAGQHGQEVLGEISAQALAGAQAVSGISFDEEMSRRIEALYVTPEVVAQRERVLQVLNLAPGENVLDIGSGPGLLASEMAQTVGPHGRVSGIDVSRSMVAMATRRCSAQPWAQFQTAS